MSALNLEVLIIASVAVIALVLFARPRATRRGAIQSPKLAFLNLKGAAGEQMLAEDKSGFAAMFHAVQESSVTPPPCDVLFIYCDVGSDGRIAGAAAGLRDIIRDSGARVVVIASENPGRSYIASARKTGYGRANLVLTLDRRGSVFTSFFSRLFAQMMKGTSMPLAWVKLAPQIPGQSRPDCPGAIFSAEAGQVTFR